MKVGDYVRTKGGQIHKISDLKPFYENEKLIEEKQSVYIDEKRSGWVYWQFKEFVVKSSPNIIDLIEVGDYVNGVLVESIYQREKDKLYIHSFDTEIMMCFTNNNIETIVTKEQFEAMQYKVGE